MTVPEGASRQPAGTGGVIELHAVRPAGRLRLSESQILRRWKMTADPAAGTLTVVGDGHLPLTFALPATGRADAVVTVCLVTYHWAINLSSGYFWRMLLLDSEDRLLGGGVDQVYPRSLRLFPPELFEPLRAAGLKVVSEFYDSPQALEDAHPGSVPKIALAAQLHPRTAGWRPALIIVAVIVVIVVAIYFA